MAKGITLPEHWVDGEDSLLTPHELEDHSFAAAQPAGRPTAAPGAPATVAAIPSVALQDMRQLAAQPQSGSRQVPGSCACSGLQSYKSPATCELRHTLCSYVRPGVTAVDCMGCRKACGCMRRRQCGARGVTVMMLTWALPTAQKQMPQTCGAHEQYLNPSPARNPAHHATAHETDLLLTPSHMSRQVPSNPARAPGN